MLWGEGQNIPEVVSDKWNFFIKELNVTFVCRVEFFKNLIYGLSKFVDYGKKEGSIILIELYSGTLRWHKQHEWCWNVLKMYFFSWLSAILSLSCLVSAAVMWHIASDHLHPDDDSLGPALTQLGSVSGGGWRSREDQNMGERCSEKRAG